MEAISNGVEIGDQVLDKSNEVVASISLKSDNIDPRLVGSNPTHGANLGRVVQKKQKTKFDKHDFKNMENDKL